MDLTTRLAPTPSGYLHEGNAVNFLLVAWLAGASGSVRLRIDDADAARARPEYVDDLFDLLPWLGIRWTAGPRSAAEYRAGPTQAERAPYFRSQLEAALDAGLDAYACRCSRRDSPGPARGGCAGGCRDLGLPWEPGVSALRARLPHAGTVPMGGHEIDLGNDLGDPVLWRRDDLPAYHLVSVVEDRDHDITHVVRGLDLLPSSALHVWLAPAFGADFAEVTWLHHGLLRQADGAKLSKSQVQHGHPLPRTPQMRSALEARAQELARPLGIDPPPMPVLP